MPRSLAILLLSVVLLFACSKSKPDGKSSSPEKGAGAHKEQSPPTPAAGFVADLQASRFDAAEAAAAHALEKDAGNATAAAVRALTRYRRTMLALVKDLEATAESADSLGSFDHDRMRAAYERTEKALGEVDGDLGIAAASADFALELCLACWEYDWNGNGRIDDGDRRLLQVEVDAEGNEIPEGDARRKPTFRFDQGDIYWARAMLAFQRSLFDLVLAYRWNELDKLIAGFAEDKLVKITIRLAHAERVRDARAQILQGLAHADRARVLYLAETDDDREWVPNPGQKSHPLPLPVDASLYETWQGVIGDVRRLVAGEEGLNVGDVARLIDDDFEILRTGYIDIGRLLGEPKDFVIDLPLLTQVDLRQPASVDAALRSLFGDRYVASMKPTPLVGRFARMKKEIERGEESLDRKLRYLIWLN